MPISDLVKYEQCENWLFTCPFSTQPDNCTNNFCSGNEDDGTSGEHHAFGSCAVDFPIPGACCSKSNPAACLASYQATINDNEKEGGCYTVRSALLSCNSIQGFATMAPQDQASCLCYNKNGAYNPSSWDNAASSCYASGSSAHPVLYSILTASSSVALGFCTKYAGPAAISATRTTETETETETEGGKTNTVIVTRTKGSGDDTDSTATVAATATTGASSVTVSASTTAAPGTVAAGVSAATTSAKASTTTAVTSGARNQHSKLKLTLAHLCLFIPSLLLAIM